MRIVEQKDFKDEIASGVTFVDFFATWCGPCKMLSPVLEQVEADNPGIKFIKVDTDEAMETAQEYGIMSIPSMFIFIDGQVVAQTGGYQPKGQLQNFIDNALK